MKRARIIAASALAAAVALTLAMTQSRDHPDQDRDRNLAQQSTEQVISAWPKRPAEVAREMIKKYGEPDGVTSEMLIWNDTGSWAQTIVYREEVQHNFPMPHTDVLEQFIHYKVPPDKFDELAQYDGSIIAERTKGVLSARCDKEAMNFLALNLAHDVATGEKSVEEARRVYAETAKAFLNGEKDELTEQLTFPVSAGGTGDPDQPYREK